MTRHTSIHDLARGKWRGILLSAGIPDEQLRDRHGPCPLCGEGTDRYRWDNKAGNGTYICNTCGAGNGIDLLMKFKGLDFKAAVEEVQSLLGTAPMDVIKPDMTEAKRTELLKALAASSQPIQQGDEVDRYLTGRGLSELVYPDNLKFCPSCYYSHGVTYPAMIAGVRDVDGKVVNLHRTYLTNGKKCQMADNRKFMPGGIPDGAAIPLGEAQEEMGIAEGIETAMAASALFELPVWAAGNSSVLSKWQPPKVVKRLWIFGDNDPKYGGHLAAYQLAHRLAVAGLEVGVKIPETTGSDWADEYLKGQEQC